MDREVILKIDGEEILIGYVSDFLIPRDDSVPFETSVFDKICEAISSLDLDGFETIPVIIEIN